MGSGEKPDLERVLLVGTSPVPEILHHMVADSIVIFYGEGVNNPWNGERNLFYLLQDVEGRGRSPFSQCLSDSECVKILLSARKVLTF